MSFEKDERQLLEGELFTKFDQLNKRQKAKYKN